MSSRYWTHETTCLLSVTNGQQSWEIELEVYDFHHGWNSMGEFELEAGAVEVELESSTRGGRLYADAIRWTKTTQQ